MNKRVIIGGGILALGVVIAILILAGVIGSAGLASPLLIIPILMVTAGLGMVGGK